MKLDAPPGPWRLEPAIKRYAWGSTTLLPGLVGTAPDDRPLAELWFGAHPAGPAQVPAADVPATLGDLVADDPDATLGEAVAVSDGRLPFMLKLIGAGQPLSIQVHPNAEHAARAFAAENLAGVAIDSPVRCYRDSEAKPEIICALGAFDALIDFRPADAVAADLERAGLGGIAEVVRAGGIAAGVRAVLSGERTATVAAIDALIASGNALAAQLAATHPGDPGVVLATFLNHLTLAPGEAAFIAPGTVHAYLGGMAVEVMATSDNVLRAGLTGKHVDVDEFLDVARLDPRPPDLLVAGADGVYPRRAREFDLLRHRPGSVHDVRGPAMVVCTGGTIEVAGLSLDAGHGAFLPASAGGCRLEGAGEAYVATSSS